MKIFNSQTGKKEKLVPLDGEQVRMYICGMTVYDDTHIGHARTFLCFDLIVRYLRNTGYKVNYVRNITDVDDKIIARAIELDVDAKELTDKYILSMQEDFNNLGMISPDLEPRATDNIDSIISLTSSGRSNSSFSSILMYLSIFIFTSESSEKTDSSSTPTISLAAPIDSTDPMEIFCS